MKKAFLCLFLSAVSLLSSAQSDQLDSPLNYKAMGGMVGEYYQSVFAKLQDGLSSRPMAQCAILSSFGQECIISVEVDSTNTCFVKKNMFTRNYWYADDRTKVEIMRAQRTIEKGIADTIRQLFVKALTPLGTHIGGVDGVTYIFSAYDKDQGLLHGEKWSPQKGTKPKALVELFELLAYYSEEKRVSAEELRKKLKQNLKIHQILMYLYLR